MANEFKIRKGYKALSSSEITGSLKITEDLTVDGTIYGINVLSSSLQIAGDISGSFTSTSSSLALRVKNQEDFSSSLDATFATDNELSASSAGVSSSLAIDIALNTSTGSDQEGRLDTLEGKTLLSGSAQIASDISGSITIFSGSIAGRVKANEDSLTSINGVTSSFLLNTTDTLTGDLTVTGTLTAQEFHTEYVSSSILHESGSTVFGNTSDDTHNFTGSLNVLGDNLVSGNVGIGTTSPSEKLDVRDGSITSRDSGNVNYAKLDRFSGLTLKGNGAGAKYISTPNTDDLGFKTNNTEKVRITSGGNVGIGTTDPSNRLEIVGPYQQTPLKVLRHADYGNVITIGRYTVSETANIGYPADATLNLSTNGSERMRITSSGNVGIGTTNPGAKLDVSGDVLIDSGEYLSWGTVGATSIEGSTASNKLQFRTSSTDRMIINDTGVGIGTNSPGAKLDVVGDLLISDSKTNATNKTNRIKGQHYTNAEEPVTFMFSNNFSSTNILHIGGGSTIENAVTSIGFYTGATNTTTQGSLAMYINNDQNVGIGTTSPLYKLDIDETTTNNLIVSRFKHNQSGVASAMQLENRAGAVNSAFDINWGLNSSGNQGTIGVVRTNLPAAGGSEMYFKTSDGEVMRLDGSGNVGIGTTNPSRKLTIGGIGNTGDGLKIEDPTNTAYGAHLTYYDAGTQVWLGGITNNVYNDTLSIHRDATRTITVGINNNVGIGTTSPASSNKLQVDGQVRVVGAQMIGDSTTSNVVTTGVQLHIKNSGEAKIRLEDSDSSNLAFDILVNEGAGFSIKETVGGDPGDDTRLFIEETTGNVGIGTTDPDSLLHVSADVSTAAVTKTGTITIEGRPYGILGDDIATIDFHNNGNKRSDIRMERGNTADDSQLVFSTSDTGTLTDRLIINEVGNVGIGTTSPQSKLHLATTGGSTLTIQNTTNSGNAALNFRDEGDNDQFQIYYALGANRSYNLVNGNGLTVYSSQSSSEIARFGNASSGYTDSYFTGNVGIGTTSPTTKLNIVNDSSGAILSFKRNNSTTAGAKGGLTWVDSSNYYVAGISAAGDGTTDNSGELVFRTSTGEASTADLGYQLPERMRIDSTGNVGIGTTNPGEKLTVIGKALLNNGSSLYVDSTATQTVFANIANIPMRFQTNSANRLTIGGAGAIQFNNYNSTNNTGTPTYLLGTDASGNIVKTNTIPGSGAGPYLPISAGSSYPLTGALYVQDHLILQQDGTNDLIKSTGNVLYHKANEYSFQDNSNSSWVTIKSGNVGIGTTSPIGMLSVVNPLSNSNTWTPTNNPDLWVSNAGTSNSYYAFGVTTNSGDIFSITNGGNVGIGTTSPGAKLHVIGSGENGGILFNNTGAQEHRLYTSANSQFNAIGSSTPIWHWAQYTGVGVSPNYKMTLNNTGLGIGTTSPDAKLDVRSTSRTAPVVLKLGNGIISGDNGVIVSQIRSYINNSNTAADELARIQVENGSGSHDDGNLSFWTRDGFNNVDAAKQLQINGKGVIDIKNNGTAALPVLIFGADVDTGFFRPSSNNIALSTSGVERIRVISGGNVGIGTTSPAAKLDVFDPSTTAANTIVAQAIKNYVGGSAMFRVGMNAGSTTADIEMNSGGAGPFRYGSYGEMNIVNNRPTSKINIVNNSSIAATIDSSGNVGIGTTGPGYKLDVNGTFRATGAGAIQGRLSVGTSSSSDIDMLRAGGNYITATNAAGVLFFRTVNTIRMTISSGGNVGIGTTSPGYKFTAYGDSADSEIVASFGSANDVNEYTAIGLSGFIASNGATKAGIALKRKSTYGTGELHFLNNNTLDNSDMTLSDSKMMINSLGNVGIGTTNPSEKLDVVGNIAASNLSGTNTGDQDLSGYLLNTTDTFAGNITFIGGNNNSKESFLNVKRGSGAGLWLKFQTDASSANNVSQFVIRRSTDNVDLLSIAATTGATTFAGTVTGSNLSGTNTGDQDLSSYALAADYLLDTTDTLTGTLTIANSNFTGLILTRNSANGSNIDFNNSDGLLGRAGFLGDGAFAITNDTIGTYNMLHLDASGNATFTANISAVSITETSARKFKDNIVPLESQLDNIGKLNPVSFNWKKDNKQDIGLIAEEVAEIYPEMVRYEEDEVTGVNYSKLTAILIKAMQEQQKQIDELKVEITTLKSTKI